MHLCVIFILKFVMWVYLMLCFSFVAWSALSYTIKQMFLTWKVLSIAFQTSFL